MEAFPLSFPIGSCTVAARVPNIKRNISQHRTLFLFPDYGNGASCAITFLFFWYRSPDHNIFARGYGSRCESNPVTFPNMVRRGQLRNTLPQLFAAGWCCIGDALLSSMPKKTSTKLYRCGRLQRLHDRGGRSRVFLPAH